MNKLPLRHFVVMDTRQIVVMDTRQSANRQNTWKEKKICIHH